MPGMIDLAQPRLGSKIIFKTDDFFASAERILSSNNPIWKEGVYDQNGKWMDGWETRRRRGPGYDYLILFLGKQGKISKVDIDTSFFNGNQPEFASIEACYTENMIPDEKVKWKTILKKSKLKPDFHNYFNCKYINTIFTHIKFNIFPDGGVARLRIYGKIIPKKSHFLKNDFIELSSILNGASIIAVNNEHFGKAENILAPGKGYNMSDGWETRRNRKKSNDWVIFKLGFPGMVNHIIIDTAHFKGNYPDYFNLQATYIDENKNISNKQIIKKSSKWKYLIKNKKLNPDDKHFFDNLLIKNKINYIKLNIFPDGGISRINVFGKI